MPRAARLSDPAAHMNAPLSPGAGSPNANIGGARAWRALPAGMGSGIESALATMKQLVDAPFLVVMDPSGAPVPGVALQITLPDGQSALRTTNRDGKVEI